jgi:4-hydroxy-4-methyl-2-oxoglutarate aldolase
MGMNNDAVARAFERIGTAQIADAVLRQQRPIRMAPFGLTAIVPGIRLAGRALPVQHFGSVDVFLEAMQSAKAGDVLVIDNNGRSDEGCIGDLTVLEGRASGLAGIVVWGAHRDSAQLKKIAFPVFSYGTCLSGPQRLDPPTVDALKIARFGNSEITGDDFVFADDDGCIFVRQDELDPILANARTIAETESRQADKIAKGDRLADQLNFREYLSHRAGQPGYTFRQHLRRIGGAIEE